MSNTMTAVVPVILAQGVMALRQNAIMARLVNTLPSDETKKKGETISIPVPSAVTAVAVTPSYVPSGLTGIVPTAVDVKLDQWWSAPFELTDKEMVDCIEGIVPMQATEAVKTLVNKVDQTILALYNQVYGYAGSPGVTPFAVSTKEATQARKVLNNQLCPLADRRFVMDADAEANALNLRAFQDYNFTGSFEDIKSGKLSPKLGFNWFMNQNIPNHTRGACDADYVINGAHATLGVKTLTVKTGSGLGLAGDIFTIAGQSQTYVLTADMTGATSMTISPGLQVALSGDEAITFVGTIAAEYPQNLAFHRDAFAFASRVLQDQITFKGGHEMSSMVDPVSGLALRLEVSREYYQTRFAFDLLFGCAVARPELACRVWG